jgi:alpha-beta hydrolase superfamily lysophospholipase
MKVLKISAIVLVSIFITVYMMRVFNALTMMALQPEHRLELTQEFDADRDRDMDWQAYLALEQRLITEYSGLIRERSLAATALNRHAANSLSNPFHFDANRNLSRRFATEERKGVAVLIHGLTDSPYSVQSTAEVLASEGYETFTPRLPGHGFAVSELRHVQGDDWEAALRIAVATADAAREAGEPLILGGYSTGGILALKYALECQENARWPCPEKILLLSPAVAISSLVRLGWLHNLISWVPFFERFQWESIYPEVDPYKFTSFPKRPAWETASLTWAVADQLDHATLPPILAFQSAVDGTVSTRAVIDMFYDLAARGHELVIYDMNRNNAVSDWLEDELPNLKDVEKDAPLDFNISVISNRSTLEQQVVEHRMAAGESAFEVGGQVGFWDDDVYSLSHIAIPFPPDDPVYGKQGIAVGAYSPRGERDVLRLTPEYFLRMRYNPFYDYQEQKIRDWLP